MPLNPALAQQQQQQAETTCLPTAATQIAHMYFMPLNAALAQQQAEATCAALLQLAATQIAHSDTTCVINSLCTAVTCETPVERGNPLNDNISVTFDPCFLEVTYQYFSAVARSQVINITTAQNETLMFSISGNNANLTLILTPWDMPSRGVNFGVSQS